MRKRLVVLMLVAVGCASCGELGMSPDAVPSGTESESSPLPTPSGGLGPFIASIPDARVPELDLPMALTLVAMPLSCVDRPHAAPRDRSTYLDEIVTARRPGYERNRAFYGCWDWHSAVNSTWAMVRIHKEFPGLPIGGLVREKLNDHLSRRALEGELEYFETAGGFERPYGYAWLLKLYAELRSWDEPQAQVWADNLQPLAAMFSERMVAFLADLDRPSRSGAHSNTAFAMAMSLDYARTVDDTVLEEAIMASAERLFGADYGCPTAYEPWGSDFLSPCLEEAALMAAVYEPDAFLVWFNEFMPPVDSRQFLPLTAPVDTAAEAADVEPQLPIDRDIPPPEEAAGNVPAPGAGVGAGAGEAEGGDGTAGAEDQAQARLREDESTRALGGLSHLIGLAFIRADAMNRIAAALPANDQRADAYRKIAALHGTVGFEAMFDADYAGSHWIGTFALKYLLSERH